MKKKWLWLKNFICTLMLSLILTNCLVAQEIKIGPLEGVWTGAVMGSHFLTLYFAGEKAYIQIEDQIIGRSGRYNFEENIGSIIFPFGKYDFIIERDILTIMMSETSVTLIRVENRTPPILNGLWIGETGYTLVFINEKMFLENDEQFIFITDNGNYDFSNNVGKVSDEMVFSVTGNTLVLEEQRYENVKSFLFSRLYLYGFLPKKGAEKITFSKVRNETTNYHSNNISDMLVSGNILSYSAFNENYHGKYSLNISNKNLVLLDIILETQPEIHRQFRIENNQSNSGDVFIFTEIIAGENKFGGRYCQINIPWNSTSMNIVIARNGTEIEILKIILEVPKAFANWNYLYSRLR
jgi:hypothetical protein